MNLSQPNFILRSPDCYLVRSYLIATLTVQKFRMWHFGHLVDILVKSVGCVRLHTKFCPIEYQLHFTLLPEKQAHSSPIMGVNIIKTDIPPHHQGNSRSKYVN